MEERTDEDRIIDSILLSGQERQYQDADFLPMKNSLYSNENVLPEYDHEVAQSIQWCRPHEICESPCYFNSSAAQIIACSGSLPDKNFLGTLLAICVYSKYDLVENIFASRPEDFLRHGIYTCRFYVDGEWVEVITDTMIPCLRDPLTNIPTPVYSRSEDRSEFWVSFLEKAFAKAVGSYEEISTMKIQKALLHLTGGSVQALTLREEVSKLDTIDENLAWSKFKERFDEECLMLLLPLAKSVSNNDSSNNLQAAVEASEENEDAAGSEDKYFIPDMIYSVVLCREISGHEMVLMHNPWSDPNYKWTGVWSDTSNDWDLYPELLVAVESDPSIPWKRKEPNGYFWITFRNCVKHFNKMYVCKLFPNEKYNFYCSTGNFAEKTAGGPLNTIRDKDKVVKDAAVSALNASNKSTAAVVIDGDTSWFCNPQYRITCTQPTSLYVSVLPKGNVDGDSKDQNSKNLNVTFATSIRTPTSPMQIWDVDKLTYVSSDKLPAHSSFLKEKGQEASLWNLECDAGNYYHVIPNTVKKGAECSYLLRIFSTSPVFLERVPPTATITLGGEWRKTRDKDSCGGPLNIVSQSEGTTKPNPKWCQNPQYHLEICDPYGKEEIFLKIVLRRMDKDKSKASGTSKKDVGDSSTCGLVVCKAQVYDDGSIKIKKKAPRQNRLGDPILPKASSLKRPTVVEAWGDEKMAATANDKPKVILRKLCVEPENYCQVSSFQSKTESVLFYPRIPRAWIPNGFLVVPCLNDKAVKGKYELDIFCSEKVSVNALPEDFAQTIAGEWTDASAGGSHISPSWDKNPKFGLNIRWPVTAEAAPRVCITLAKHGPQWRAQSKKDTIGCMIGFYVLVSQYGETHKVFESVFSPDHELATDPSFTLERLPPDAKYIIMPTTFEEGKVGPFVISVMCEYEFDFISIKKEEAKGKRY